jgi:uncharacterized protein (TIGR02231 family)
MQRLSVHLSFSLFLAFSGLCSLPVRAGETPAVPSRLLSATVFRAGAELTHKATAELAQGNNVLVIGDISNAVDEGSIQVGCNGNVTILSATFSTEYLKDPSVTPLIRKLDDSVESVKRELTRLDVLIRSDNDLLELLGTNKNIGGSQNGLSVAELMKMMDYYKQKAIELRNELTGYNEKEVRLQRLIEKLQNQLQEEKMKNTGTSGRILLQLISPAAGSYDFTVSYITPNAYWKPFYDLKADNSTDPLRLLYKARLVQTSGIDWKQVKLSLSTSVPNQSGNAPLLKAWFLGFVDPVALSYAEDLRKNATINSLAYRSRDPRNDSNMFAFGHAKGLAIGNEIEKKSDLGDYVSVNDNQMDVTFDIEIPYDIPGNGKDQAVVLKEYKVPCTYQYYAAPALDKDAYLLCGITGWEKLNLLPGEAGVTVEGTYIGKSFIDPNSTQDTLNLTMGRDKRVVVKREKLMDYSSVKFLGANKRQVFTYQITAKNNKKEKIQLLLKDQYPVSTNKDIEVELLENSGAAVNSEMGILSWKTEMAPGESRIFRISYSIRYPKDKNLNTN